MGVVRPKARLVLMRDRGRLTIPASLREEHGLKEGCEVVMISEGDRLIIYPRQTSIVEQVIQEHDGAA